MKPKYWGHSYPPPNPEIEKLEFLEKAGVDPWQYVNAEMAAGDGFELPQTTKEQLFCEAVINSVRKKHSQPPSVQKDRAVWLGNNPDLGFPVFLNVSEMGHTLILGPTNSGKNNAARQIAKGVLPQGKQFQTIGQKGDELNDVNLWPSSIYLPIQRDSWPDWQPIGPNRTAFWTAAAEAFAIPKAIAPQTQPEFPLILEQMWRSAPNFSWFDLGQAFKWKAQQPGGREKHATAYGVINAYATWMGNRAYVQKGVDIRDYFQLSVIGCFGASLDNIEAWLGMLAVREMFAALARGHSREPRIFICIPEGQLLFSRDLEYARRGNVSYLTRMIAMAHSMGIIFIILAQSPSKLSQIVTGNTPTVIVMRQDSQIEAEFCAERLGAGEELIGELMSLPLGVGYVRTAGWDRSVKVRFPFVDLGPALTPAQLETRYKDEYERLGKSTIFRKKRR